MQLLDATSPRRRTATRGNRAAPDGSADRCGGRSRSACAPGPGRNGACQTRLTSTRAVSGLSGEAMAWAKLQPAAAVGERLGDSPATTRHETVGPLRDPVGRRCRATSTRVLGANAGGVFHAHRLQRRRLGGGAVLFDFLPQAACLGAILALQRAIEVVAGRALAANRRRRGPAGFARRRVGKRRRAGSFLALGVFDRLFPLGIDVGEQLAVPLGHVGQRLGRIAGQTPWRRAG